MTREELTVELYEHAARVANALPGAWTARRGEWWAEVRNDEAPAEVLHVSRNGDGRYHWSGIYPRDAQGQDQVPYRTARPTITTGPAQPVARVARDVARRLVPAYRALLAEVQARIDEANDYAAQTTRSTDRLARVLGASSRAGRDADRLFVYAGEVSGDLQISGDSVRLDLRGLTAEQAERALRVVLEGAK